MSREVRRVPLDFDWPLNPSEFAGSTPTLEAARAFVAAGWAADMVSREGGPPVTGIEALGAEQ